MTVNALKHDSFLDERQQEHTPCPTWKKVVAGVLVVTAVAMLIPGTVWLDHLDVSWTALLFGLAASLVYGLGLVLAGIALVTLLLWAISRSQQIMKRGRGAVEYAVNCYPEEIKGRILDR